jgi:hypothetical protein
MILPLEIDFGTTGPALDAAAWEQEYRTNIMVDETWAPKKLPLRPTDSAPRSLSKESLTIEPDPFADPLRFDPWEYLYDRY